MIITRISVACDQCLIEAIPEGGPIRASVPYARRDAVSLGWRRVEITAGPLAGRKLDLCPECQAKAGLR